MSARLRLFLAALLFCTLGHAQQGWWTWMKGTNVSGNPGSFGTIGVAAPANDPPSLYEAGEWTDQQGRFWIFGGLDNGHNEHGALWMYDPTTGNWTWMKGPSTTLNPGVYGTLGIPAPANTPGARSWGMVTWVDNAGDLWLFGGQGYDAAGLQGNLSDLWRYNIASNMWTWMNGPNARGQSGNYGTATVAAATNVPPSKYEISASWTANNGELYMFGGITFNPSFGNLNDLWKYNIGTNMWTWMRGSSTVSSTGNYGAQGVMAPTNDPPARSAYAKWKDLNGDLWFWGGSDVNLNYYNDLWKYSVASNQWTWIRGANTTNSAGNTGSNCVFASTSDPLARGENRACWTDRCGNFWMFGGGTGGSFTSRYNDLWYYNVQSNQWAWVSNSTGVNPGGVWGALTVAAAANHPNARAGSNGFRRSNGELWLFGGTGAFGPTAYNDLWRFVPDTTNCTPNTCALSLEANFSTANISGCLPYLVNFTNSSTGANTYSWNFGDTQTSTATNPSHTYTTAGTFTVTLIASNSPNSDTSTFTITVHPVPTASITGNDSICPGSSTTLTGAGGGTYSWSTGATTSPITVNPIANTTYTLVVSNGFCFDTTRVNVVVRPKPTATISGIDTICAGGSTLLTGGGGGTYSWSTGATTGPITVNPPATTTYTLVVSNGQCTDTSRVKVVVDPYPVPFITGDSVLCQGQSMVLTASGGTTYSWSTGATTASITINPSLSGTYKVTAANGPCSKADSVHISVYPAITVEAGINDTINLGTSVQLTATGNGNTYAWSPSAGLSCITCPNPTASPEYTTSYIVTTRNAHGCVITDTVTVVVDRYCGEVFVPEAFSPNGDGENDYACVYGRCITKLDFSIFDRWGEKVFESNDKSICWDGMYRGERMNPAVFVYYLKATLLTGQVVTKKGNITLVR